MVRSKKNPINDTLTNLLIEVFSGVNYVSKLALQTKKSIPVTFRQLEELMTNNIITKSRKGKKVEYFVNWNKVSNVVEEIVDDEIKQVSNFVKSSKDGSDKIFEELNLLSNEVSKDLKIIIKNVFLNKEIQKMVEQFFYEIKTTKDIFPGYDRVEFNDIIGDFLDFFNSLDQENLEKILLKFTKEQRVVFEKFLKICKIHGIYHKLTSPLHRFKSKYLK
jgi:hypothetical protein|tara:strand:+ start:882 stop:1538 length:657 start_codon:yes stop_codon:yes gene_type:complete